MSNSNKIVWSEGIFLRPQHFQQHDRYIETLVRERCGGLQPFDWGVKRLTIAQDKLAQRKFALSECSGIFPDGTPFNLSKDDALPDHIDIPIGTQNKIVYLAIPMQDSNTAEIKTTDDVSNSLARYQSAECKIKDLHTANNTSTSDVLIAKLRTSLLLETQEISQYSYIPIAKIITTTVAEQIVLDEHFIPATLDCNANPVLKSYINELHGLLHGRGEALAERVSQARGNEITDHFLLLLLYNRMEPLFSHLQHVQSLRPESFYRIVIQLAGELAIFHEPKKRLKEFPPYIHSDLQSTFKPVIEKLRELLKSNPTNKAIQIAIEDVKDYPAYRMALKYDRNLIKTAQFMLAAKSSLNPQELQSRLPKEVRIASNKEMKNKVENNLPGIELYTLYAAPREIPDALENIGFSYFELNKQCKQWQEMLDADGFIIHISSHFPGLELKLWAI
jgi:type VI secretion system protein ImpJ